MTVWERSELESELAECWAYISELRGQVIQMRQLLADIRQIEDALTQPPLTLAERQAMH